MSPSSASGLQPTLFERSRPGRGGGKIPHPPADALDRIPAAAPARDAARACPSCPSPRWSATTSTCRSSTTRSTRASTRSGSCTMKYNPKLNEWAARLPGFAGLHPMAPDAVAQGTLQLLYDLEAMLAEISGMDAVTLQPAAGAHGELTGILMIRAYHRARGDTERDEVLVPDSARTAPTRRRRRWPASGRSRSRPRPTAASTSTRSGRRSGPRTAAIMITNPSTLGLFERRIGELLDATHEAGALAYMDGANLNAILGPVQARRGRVRRHALQHPQDVQHAARRRRPRRRPVGVRAHLVPYLPAPRVVRDGRTATTASSGPGERPTSIGRVRSFVGSTGVLVRAYAYIRAHGDSGLREVCDDAVLAANYLKRARARGLRHPVRPGLQARVRRVRLGASSSGPASGPSTSPSG